MRLLLISDIHFGVRKNSENYISITKAFFKENVKKVIETEKIDQLWILGDLFDDRHLIDTKVKMAAFEVFEYLLEQFKTLKIKVTVGNHDIYYKTSLYTTSLKMFYEFHDRLEIINSTKEYDLDGCNTIVYPWLIEDSDDYKHFRNAADHFKETGEKIYDLCLGHFEINGFEVMPGVVHETGLSTSDFDAFGHVFSGHFHLRQKKGNIQYCGCPYQITWGDYGDKKGITIFDTKTRQTKFIENKTSPQYIQIKTSELQDDEELVKLAKNNFVKLFIDKPINDNDRLNLITKITEGQAPLDLTIIDEVDGTEINDQDVELDEGSLEGNEVTYMNEYIDQLGLDTEEFKDLSTQLKLYSSRLYTDCLKD